MNIPDLTTLEEDASKAGLMLRIQVRRPLNLWIFKVVVAQYIDAEKIKFLAEMKGWAYSGIHGMQIDTLQVHSKAPNGVGDLVWSATMAWALECTPCQKVRLLAINDDEFQHKRLKRYFRIRGFTPKRDVAASAMDLPLRIVWGGSGTLMVADCLEVLERSSRRWKLSMNDS